MITPELIVDAIGATAARAQAWAPALDLGARVADIKTAKRLAAWLAQIGHETGRLRYSAELWGPTAQQRRYEPTTSLSRRLGNSRPGDGRRFSGHGALQITGRYNHASARDRLRQRFGETVPDFEAQPALLATPLWGAIAAADYWISRKVNVPADLSDAVAVTRIINGGLNGLADRVALTARARAACILHGVDHA